MASGAVVRFVLFLLLFFDLFPTGIFLNGFFAISGFSGGASGRCVVGFYLVFRRVFGQFSERNIEETNPLPLFQRAKSSSFDLCQR